MRFFIGNDHGGYQLKKAIMLLLRERGHKVINAGSDSADIVRYPYFAAQVASAVSMGQADRGILICNSGIGMSIAANKYRGVRAALVYDGENARMTRLHNDSNVLCLSGKSLNIETALEIVEIWTNTEFEGGRHCISLGLINEIEAVNFSGECWESADREKAEHRSEYYQAARTAPANILLDTDMLTDCDDTAALAMLLNLEKQGHAHVLGVTVSSRYDNSSAVVSAVCDYYNRSDMPIGAPKNGTGAYRDDSCFLDVISAEFPHTIENNARAEDAVRVMRKALAGAQDASVIIATIGYMSNLVALLQSGEDDISPLSGRELVKQKVAEWACMGGNFPDDPAKDNVNFTRDPEPALYCIRNFPGQITFVGREIGHNIFLGNCLKSLPEENPVRRSYELHRGRYGDDWDHHTADPSTILYAVFGCGDFFDEQEGVMDIRDDCSFTWDPAEKSNKVYLLQRMDRKAMKEEMERILLFGM